MALPTSYQRVTTATDYDTSVCKPYLALDGTDDSFGTNSIDFSATDKMSVCAGVTKLSDAAVGIVVGLSSTPTNLGSIELQAPAGTAVGNYQYRSNGTALVGAVSPSTYASPVTNVLTGISDIGGPVVTLNINGTQAATNTSTQGTGNYGNYPLYIGRRSGSALPFNGRIYQLIVCGKTLSASELASTEAYVATKTGVTL